jgi:hypothetical protein
MLLDGALTTGFDETTPLLIGLGWLIGLGIAFALTYRHSVAPTRIRTRSNAEKLGVARSGPA